jgi:predicted RecB family nuclease
MQTVDGALRLSASDLMRFKGCAHATTLDLRRLEVGDLLPDRDDDEALLLQQQGDAHEAAYLQGLKDQGRAVVEIRKDGLPLRESVAATREALGSGAEVVFQGAFLSGVWGGYSDFLELVSTPSNLGDFSYEVVDTKLKRSPDPKHVLQLALYSDMLAEIQGRAPEAAHLELGDGARASIRLAEVSAYSRHARRRLESFIAERPQTTPEPVAACQLCRWRSQCQAEWEAAESLSLVAGISRSQRQKLSAAGVMRLGDLAKLNTRVPHLAPETQSRLQAQARLQAVRRAGGAPAFEPRPREPGKGLALLPEPNEGDIFYDIEGDPFFPGGLEYLHGVWFFEAGEWRFRAFWAHDRAAEGQAVADLMDFFVERLQAYPRAHIYHYANYEMAALRRLTAAHRLGEAAMDQLQRERRFIDLFRVVSGGLVASEPGYSIKDLEVFYMEKRAGEVATAGASVVVYERFRQTGDAALLEEIRSYNETDCRSTQLLRDWLVAAVRPADMAWRALGEVAEGGALANVAEEDAEEAALRARLAPAVGRLGAEAVELLADLHGFHAREDKPAWWAIFDRLAADSDDLIDDLDCLTGLEAIGPAEKVTAKSYERTYRFPQQETKLRAGKKPCVKPAAAPSAVDIRDLDPAARTIVLRRTLEKGALPDQLDLIPPMPIKNDVLRNAVAAVAGALVNVPGSRRAVEHLLIRAAPAFRSVARPNGIVDREAELEVEVSHAISDLDQSVLAIQGPPGTGKTYVSARAIVDLVRAGRRVAVSSNSHKAISNLLQAVAARARKERVAAKIVQKASDDGDDEANAGILLVADNKAPEIAQADVVGATAWHFARYAEPVFDVLIVDEAGQVSLANLLAMAACARNLVLVGDPMQLPQPLQGVHPGLSGQSCLEYLIGDHRVVPPERGIFMPISRRMHPGVCGFISKTIYEGRLDSDEGAAGQTLTDGPDGADLTGARLQAIAHAGNAQTSREEIDAIRDAVARLAGATYRDRNGRSRQIGLDDILVVAPYNAQVNALRAALPAAVRVGTVDRFQGQEAPVCLVSMTTSSAEELPRDIAFLFSLNRINVAVSRAQVAAIVYASPALLETPCRTIQEMALVNALCALADYRPAAV